MDKEKLKKDIGLRVTEIREKRMHMTKKDFSRLITMKSQYLGAVESGKRGLTVEKAVEICNISGVSPDYLLSGGNMITNSKSLLVNYTNEDLLKAFDVIRELADAIK